MFWCQVHLLFTRCSLSYETKPVTLVATTIINQNHHCFNKYTDIFSGTCSGAAASRSAAVGSGSVMGPTAAPSPIRGCNRFSSMLSVSIITESVARTISKGDRTNVNASDQTMIWVIVILSIPTFSLSDRAAHRSSPHYSF